MASFFPNTDRSLVERIMIGILRQGEIPKHIAFIMDGNRRYARQRHVEKLIGHSRGFDKLAETLSWCRDLGITQATMYAFSIENFKRPPDEVDGLMNLFRHQFAKLIDEFPKFDSYEICVRIYGRVDLLPLDIQQSIAKVVLRTAKNRRFYLNVAFAYTAREEIASAMGDLEDCARAGLLTAEDINDRTLSSAMYSLGIDDPDILLRTSGEVRISDFLLWQTNFSYIFFVKELWPEFSIWSLFRGILHYQVQGGSIRRAKEAYKAELHRVDMKTCNQMHQDYLLNGGDKSLQSNGSLKTGSDSPATLPEFTENRAQRIEQCIEFIRLKRLNRLRDLVKDLDLESDQINNNKSSADADPPKKKTPTLHVNGYANGHANGHATAH